MNKLSCPNCGHFGLKEWMEKLKCRSCAHVFYRHEAIKKEYEPQRKYRTRKISDLQEKSNAKKTGGRTVIASGATKWDKADVKGDLFRMECKSTEGEGYRLTLADLDKLFGQTEVGKIPVFAIEFRRPSGNRQFMVVPEDWFLHLLALRKQEENA